MEKFVLVHEFRLPHQIVEHTYEVTDITEEYIETKELGKLPRKYVSTAGNKILVNNSSIFYLLDPEGKKRVDVLTNLQSQLVEFLKIRTQYCDEIDNIKRKVEHIDLRIKDISNEMKRIAEGGTLNVK